MKTNERTLIQWLIEEIDGNAYRKGTKTGVCHPKVTSDVMQATGGRKAFLEQVDMIKKDSELGRTGLIDFKCGNLGMDIKQVDCAVEVMPELCRRAGIEDPRTRQLRYIDAMEHWKKQAEGTWLVAYYENELQKLNKGQCCAQIERQIDVENGELYHCLNEMVHLEEPLEKPIFSAKVFYKSKGNERIVPSKRFRERYQKRVCGVIKEYSPEYMEDMSEDEMLAAHGILSYSQTLEWKGRVIYTLDSGDTVDTKGNVYGTVLNAKTLEHIVTLELPGIRRILTIENKANYEKMEARGDELYIYCHGFFSPKEVHVLKKMEEVSVDQLVYEHWGDWDYGGIRIFQFIKSEVFGQLHSYKMDVDAYENALKSGAGVPLEPEKRKKLDILDAGSLNDLKMAILEYGMEIEQELLI